MNEYKRFISDTDDKTLSYKVEYHECRNEFIAKKMYKELKSYEIDRSSKQYDIQLDQPFDEYIGYQDYHNNFDTIVIRKGNYVVSVYLKIFNKGEEIDCTQMIKEVVASISF